MPEYKKIEFVDQEAEDFSNLGPAMALEFIINKYFHGESGQDKLIQILEKTVYKSQDVEDILDFINDLMTEGDDKNVEAAAQKLDKELDLVNILSTAAGKTKEEIEKELAVSLKEKAERLKLISARLKNKPASARKISN